MRTPHLNQEKSASLSWHLKVKSGWDEVICRLEHRLLSSELDYEALSYCWGVDHKDHLVTCDEKTINVTANLFTALRHLSFQRKERRLWVDGICINQNDNHEKSHQVSMMGEIYSSANRTVVWLGEDTQVEAAVARVERIRLPFIPPTSDSSLQRLVREILPMFDAAWFNRLWVVQEVALARDCRFVAGYEQVALDKLEAVVKPIEGSWKSPGFSVVNFVCICGLRRCVQSGSKSPFFLLFAIMTTVYFDVTDKRDRLYALFGLSPASKGFPIQYHEKNRTANDLFIDFAVWALSEFPDLAALSFTRGPDNTLPAPSWAAAHSVCPIPLSFLYHIPQ